MSKKHGLYVGKAGQAVGMAEFLIRGWNVAVPEVDVGDDLFVVRDSDGVYNRIQVKTASGVKTKYGFRAQFSVSLLQMEETLTPDLAYVFVVRFNYQWQDFIVISRQTLFREHKAFHVGTKQKNGNHVIFNIQYHRKKEKKVIAGKRNWTAYQNDFSAWQKIQH